MIKWLNSHDRNESIAGYKCNHGLTFQKRLATKPFESCRFEISVLIGDRRFAEAHLHRSSSGRTSEFAPSMANYEVTCHPPPC